MTIPDFREAILEREAWCVDRLEINENEICLSGWAFPKEGIWDSVNFFINGKPVDFEYRLERKDLLQVFPFWSGSGEIGFKIVLSKSQLSFEDEFVVISRHPDNLASKYDNYYFPRDEQCFESLPFDRLRKQVHGSDSRSSFVLEGYSCYRKLDFIVREFFDENLLSMTPILDWGCGCGRVCRYLPSGHIDLHGVDINEEAIKWCLSGLPHSFMVSDIKPPLAFDDDYFAVVYGISILTHLSHEDQTEWIEELIRVTKQGGIIILSFHGFDSLLRMKLGKRELHRLYEKHFLDLGRNNAFPADSKLGANYLDIIQFPSSLEKIISPYDVELSFYSGVFGNHQDVVVLRKN